MRRPGSGQHDRQGMGTDPASLAGLTPASCKGTLTQARFG